jgi:hypothetical protein
MSIWRRAGEIKNCPSQRSVERRWQLKKYSKIKKRKGSGWVQRLKMPPSQFSFPLHHSWPFWRLPPLQTSRPLQLRGRLPGSPNPTPPLFPTFPTASHDTGLAHLGLDGASALVCWLRMVQQREGVAPDLSVVPWFLTPGKDQYPLDK